MILFIILFYLRLFLCDTGRSHGHSSSIVRNNKIYVYETISSKGNGSSITIYNLEDGPISEIKSKEVIFYPGPKFTPQFLNMPDATDGDLWLIGGQGEHNISSNVFYREKFTGQLIKDNEFKFNPDLLSPPDFKHFPKGGFSHAVVKQNDKLVLYVIGGYVYNTDKKILQITNYFFKYDFKDRTWSDISHLTKSILPPIANHQNIIIDNEYLLVANGLSHNTDRLTQLATADNNTAPNFVEKVYKFDLKKLEWSVINTKPNLNKEEYDGGDIYGAPLDYYNGKILSYAALHNVKLNQSDPRIALLDLKTWEWEWISLKSDTGVDNSLILIYHQTLLVNDQLVLIHGKTNQRKERGIFVIDLIEHKFKTALNYSGTYGQAPKLPTYAIVIISVVCILAVILIIFGLWYFLRYKKRQSPNSNSDTKMTEVWANPSTVQNNRGEYTTKDGQVAKFETTNTAIFGNTVTSTGDSEGKELTDAALSLTYFQHEVDTKDMEDKKLVSNLQ